MSKGRQHAPEITAKGALEALNGEATVSRLASLFCVPRTMISQMETRLAGRGGWCL